MRQYLIKHTISDISCEKYYPIRKQYKLKKSGFPIVRRAEGDAARKSVLVLFPLPALWKSAKITEKSVRVYAKTNTLTFTNTLKCCIMSVQAEYRRQVKYHCLLLTFVKRLELAEAVLT